MVASGSAGVKSFQGVASGTGPCLGRWPSPWTWWPMLFWNLMNGGRTSSSRHAITVCYYLSNTSIAIISGLCSLLQHFVNNVFGILGWRVDHQTMNWQWYILGPWLKYGPWPAIWSVPRGTVFGWPYGLSNQWMATILLSGWPCLYLVIIRESNILWG